MNTGIADAVNLGWKLAVALAGRGGDALLDSYQTERLPIVRRLISSTTASTGPMLWRNPIAVAARNTALRLLLHVPAVQTALFDGFTGFTVRYPPTGHVDRRTRGPRVGDIAPETARGAQRWYQAWGADPRHQLLVFTGPDVDTGGVLTWARQHADIVRPLLVTRQQRPGPVDTVLDPTSELHRRFAAQRGGTYLIRPDGHIGARTSGTDLAPLTAYLDDRLRPDPSHADRQEAGPRR